MKSNMRLMSFMALLASLVFGTITLLHPAAVQDLDGLYLTFGFLLGAFAPKALQKFAESKVPKSDTDIVPFM